MLRLERYISVAIAAGSVVVSYVIVKYFVRRHSNRYCKSLPPSIGSLPIVGSLPYLPNMEELHLFFLEKSLSLGPVFSFCVGSQYTVVLNSHAALREAFVKRSLDFADRPILYTDFFHNPNRKGFINHSYDAELKRSQQLTLQIFKQFGFGRSVMEERIVREVEDLIGRISANGGRAFDPQTLLCSGVLNVVSSVLFAQRFGDSADMTQKLLDALHQLIHESFALFALELVPWLRFLPSYSRCIKRSVLINQELLEMIERNITGNSSPNSEECFTSCFLQEEGIDREQLLYIIRDMLLGGIDSTMITLQWALVFLANDQELQASLQRELDGVVTRDRLPSLGDKAKLPLVEATVLEIMRYKTMFPLGAPHATACDTEVLGYCIPKGTTVMPNLYAAHMNTAAWQDPQVFRPHRFLDPNSESVINRELMISFSLGKRSCPGETLARQQIFLFMTGLLQHFNITPPEGPTKIEVRDVMADTLAPSEYTVCFKPRI